MTGALPAHSQPDVAIRIRGLTTYIGGNLLHDNIDLDVYRGEIMAIVGGSGAGKSVLLHHIIGLRHAQSGQIDVLGCDIDDPDEAAMQDLRSKWGVLFQDGALFSSQSVAENIAAAIRVVRPDVPPLLLDEIVAMKLSMVGLGLDTGAKYPSELSGGMRKRAGLARSLAHDPQLLFLDEPTAGLDPIGAHSFDTLLRNLQRSLGLTVVLVTHDLDTLKLVADRIAVLVDKKLIVGTMDELIRNDHPWIQDYFQGERGRVVIGGRG